MSIDIHSADPKTIRAVLKAVDSRIKRYNAKVESATNDDDKITLSSAVATLIILKNDLKALLSEIETSSSISPKAKKEVENLLSDVLIEFNRLSYNKGKQSPHGSNGGSADEQAADDMDT